MNKKYEISLHKSKTRTGGGMIARIRPVSLALALAALSAVTQAQQEAVLSVTAAPSGDLVIAVNPSFHAAYACAYPLTYEFDVAPYGGGLKSARARSSAAQFLPLPEKNRSVIFNGVEAVRFDYAAHRAYVSASFGEESDSLFLRITDSLGSPLHARYLGISRYYDDRRAAVTITADDWADWTAGWYHALLGIFRSRGLYVTAGVISGPGNTTRSTWLNIQNELNLGFVEVAAHSRTHSHTPYAQPVGEVLGCEQDIELLSLPPLFSVNGAGCVYVWLAPYGDYDASTDSLLGVGHYLVPRLYAYAQAPLSPWLEKAGHFAPVTPTAEIGAPSWGGGDTNISSLNGTFDAVAAQGGVYHFMWHPQVIIADTAKPYFVNHLNYVGGRPDIWYVNLGHLYLYHMIQQMNSAGVSGISTAARPETFRLEQNYPNPFNPSTTIRYSLPARTHVTLSVFNTLGQIVATIASGEQEGGSHEVKFDGAGLSSGVYFYRIQAGSFVQAKRLVLVR